ncbi:major capsid protein [Lachnotalea glycerini]|uniref:Major capsid protein n=1 Tax=Lachnotalea glycerini TaxID=1763509 RepID=A0A371J793_9FIRM|nr:major capsid protein [Lachnotalea glycerini]RDY28650.1 major capsid protein [Lachnotalea glycerini]
MDFTKTLTLLAAVEQMPPITTFLKDRYFPTNDVTDIFTTEEVLVEYKDGNKKLAPFVSPRKNGVTMLRDGYNIKSYAPANIAPKRPLYVDDLKKKGFGEALFSKLTPEQRQMALILKDTSEMDEMITRREESMAAETMLTNGCVMHHYADKGDEYEEKEIRFYDDTSNPAVYTPSLDWDSDTADLIEDIYQMILMLIQKGNAATEVILGTAVVNPFINNEKIQKLLDIRNYNIGSVEPMELPTGASRIAQIVVKGHKVDILSYAATYENKSGEDTLYIPSNKVIVTAPAAGRTAYGAVTQVEQSDGEMHTYTGKRIPHYVASAENNSRSITLTSCPLLMPNRKNPWIVADVLTK